MKRHRTIKLKNLLREQFWAVHTYLSATYRLDKIHTTDNNGRIRLSEFTITY